MRPRHHILPGASHRPRGTALTFFRQLYRAIRIALVFGYSVVELVITHPRNRADRAAWLTGLCRRLLRSINGTCSATGPVPTSGAVISNHLSYVDILVHSAIRPCVFVSKMEVRRLPLFGWISFMAGTVYVERGAGGSARRAAEGMAKGFRDGLPVTFFPEGTTGVGDVPVMPFHSGLLAQALAAEEPILPGFIRYTLSPEDTATGYTTHNDIHWGPQTLPAHLWRLCGIHGVHASIHFASEPIAFSERALTDRKLAATEAQAAMLTLSQASEETVVHS